MFGTTTAKPTRATPAKDKDPAYERKKIREADRSRKLTASGRDIGELPAIANPARRAACERDFLKFCLEYFPDLFPIAFSSDHLEVIQAIQTTVLDGGLFALAMPRGSGKTTLCEVACIWAAVYGHHQFIVLIGADSEAATESLESVKTQLQTNDLLAADFPEVCIPFHKLEGIQQRRMLYNGKLVKIKMTKTMVILPDIPGSKAGGVIFKVAGITGRIRGMKYTRTDKKTVRPTLVLIDDPQTDESAASESMCASRERTVSKAVKGLAGPKKKIAALMPCTVIRKGDMADRMLNREIHPAWQGRRYRLVYEWPTRMDLWEQYVSLRHEAQRRGCAPVEATDFYRKNRLVMDAGAKVGWQERYNDDELSAIQNAINLRFENKEGSEEAFRCEYQNDPPDIDDGTEALPTAEEIAARINSSIRRIVPPECAHLVAFIDVHPELLYYEVMGSEANFTPYVIDYDSFPGQPTSHFSHRAATNTLQKKFPKGAIDGRLYAALTEMVEWLLKDQWKIDGGQTLRLERIGIDGGYKTALIHKFCRESPHAAILYPCHGKGIKIKEKPLRDYKTEKGEKLGEFWYLSKGKTKARTIRHIVNDVNLLKTFLFDRLTTPVGDVGAMTLFKNHPTNHRMYCEHSLAEFRTKVKANGREGDEWAVRPHKPDNHLLDCSVGCLSLLSQLGCKLYIPGSKPPKKSKPRETREAEYL